MNWLQWGVLVLLGVASLALQWLHIGGSRITQAKVHTLRQDFHLQEQRLVRLMKHVGLKDPNEGWVLGQP